MTPLVCAALVTSYLEGAALSDVPHALVGLVLLPRHRQAAHVQPAHRRKQDFPIHEQRRLFLPVRVRRCHGLLPALLEHHRAVQLRPHLFVKLPDGPLGDLPGLVVYDPTERNVEVGRSDEFRERYYHRHVLDHQRPLPRAGENQRTDGPRGDRQRDPADDVAPAARPFGELSVANARDHLDGEIEKGQVRESVAPVHPSHAISHQLERPVLE